MPTWLRRWQSFKEPVLRIYTNSGFDPDRIKHKKNEIHSTICKLIKRNYLIINKILQKKFFCIFFKKVIYQKIYYQLFKHLILK